MTLCSNCKEEIIFRQNSSAKWVPMNPDGTPHLETCQIKSSNHYLKSNIPYREQKKNNKLTEIIEIERKKKEMEVRI
jgi:hypothetical protein